MKTTLAAISTALVLVTSLGAQTIINGGFEDDPVTPGGYDPITPTGWTYVGGIPWVTSVTAPGAVGGAAGDNYLQAERFMIISQDISGLIVGQEYEITYLIGNSEYPKPDIQSGSVSIGGVVVDHVDYNGSGVPMTPASIVFTAGSTIETLLLYSKSGTTAFDGFSITPIPEPRAALLIGLSGVALIARRRN